MRTLEEIRRDAEKKAKKTFSDNNTADDLARKAFMAGYFAGVADERCKTTND